MRRLAVPLAAAAVLAAGAGTALRAAPPAAAKDGRGPYRLQRLDDAKSRASIPFRIAAGGPPCNAAIPNVPVIVGPDFDPATVDQIETLPNGRIVAWATTIAESQIPGTSRDVVLYREGVLDPERVSDASGENDQPSLAFDPFGYRLAWRGSDGARGTTPGNIWLRSARRVDPTPPATGGTGGTTDPHPGPSEDVTTVQVTHLVATATDPQFGTAYDPSLSARIRVRDAGSGVKVRVRDARVAFVSTGDLAKGSNPAHDPQLFVWRERADDFVQITAIDQPGFFVNRPSISVAGDRIAFECDFDLTPGAVDPKDPTRVGNPDGYRQIYLWQDGRGIRQLTWGDGDSLAPRISLNGRFVLFCSKGDLIRGGNPEGNFEVFAWVDGRDPSRSLRQLTATAAGQSVLPRPTRSPGVFAFWSTASPAEGGAAFGAGAAQCGPLPYLHRRGAVVRLGGLTDAENLTRIAESPDPASPESPVVAGPPCVGGGDDKIEFVTNDWHLNARGADDDLDGDNGQVIDDLGDDDPTNDVHAPDDRKVDVSPILYHVARVTRHAPRRRRR